MAFFSFLNKPTPSNAELPDIYPLSLKCKEFVKADIEATYTKILTDTLERTSGIPDDKIPLLWDNCVQGESPEGLVTLLAKAMTNKAELYIVYTESTGVIRRATSSEQTEIQKDYKEKAESAVGTYVSFKNYTRTDMLEIYATMEHCVLASLYKTVNLSKAVQVKMSKLRDSVSLTDSGIAVAQAKSIADALAAGKDVLLDAADNITTATPDTSATEKAITFLDSKRAYYLNLPLSYVSGVQTAGIGSTGEADMRAVERGLKQFYFSVIKPVVEAVFAVSTSFKSQDFRQMGSALEALKTFELVAEDDLLPRSMMRQILSQLFNLDLAEVEDALEEEQKEAAKVRVNPTNQLPAPNATQPRAVVN